MENAIRTGALIGCEWRRKMMHLHDLSLAAPKALLQAVCANGANYLSQRRDLTLEMQPAVSRDELVALFHDKLR